MILDIIIIILLIIYVLIGRRRGFVLEFIHLFKYILIIYITRFIYEIIKINNKNLKEQYETQKLGQFFGNHFFDNKSYIYSFYYIRSCIIGIVYFKQ